MESQQPASVHYTTLHSTLHISISMSIVILMCSSSIPSIHSFTHSFIHSSLTGVVCVDQLLRLIIIVDRLISLFLSLQNTTPPFLHHLVLSFISPFIPYTNSHTHIIHTLPPYIYVYVLVHVLVRQMPILPSVDCLWSWC